MKQVHPFSEVTLKFVACFFSLVRVYLPSSLVAQCVKDLALSLQWPGLMLWHGFYPWLRNFRMPWALPKKKKKKKSLPSSNTLPLYIQDENPARVQFDFPAPGLGTLVIHFTSTAVISCNIRCYCFCLSQLSSKVIFKIRKALFSIHQFMYVCMYVFVFFRAAPMEAPRLGVELELQLLAYTTATAMQDLSPVCYLQHSSQQCWILNLLSEARARTCVLMNTGQVC